MTRRSIATVMMLAVAGSTASLAAPSSLWVPAWTSAQMRVEGKDADAIGKLGPATIRQIVHLSADGTTVRVRLSNLAGDRPLLIAAASIADAHGPGSDTVARPRPLSFSGAAAVTIPARGEIYADPAPFAATAGGDVAISLFLPAAPRRFTGHPGSRATAFLAAGNQAGATSLASPTRIGSWWNLADVEVAGGTRTGAIVAIGDSITDGHGIADDSNARWTDVFARRVAANPATARLSVVNAGIGGNRVLRDGVGPSLLARFDRDVIARPAVRYVIVLEGVNDLGTLTRDAPASAAAHHAVVAAITHAYRQMAARAHGHGIALIGGTITPDVGNDYYHPSPESEADRQAINDFVRSSGTFDGVVDFDRAVRDPAHPDRLLPRYDSGDHLHPGEEGYRAMAAAVPLSLFVRTDAASADRPPKSVVGIRPQIALTFDDIPAHGPLPAGEGRLGIARAIIAALAAHHAPAFGFMNAGFGVGVSDAPQVLAAWHAAGLPIGNHGYGHLDLAQVGAAAFLADAKRNEAPLAAAAGAGDWHWFRYPFLSEGRDAATTATVRARLSTDGYRIAAVTMSFGDYAWNDAYARCVAHHDRDAIGALETSYLAAARGQALRSRGLAHAALGRDIPYVLLMHLGAFDARMLPRLLSLYEEMGFAFTSLTAAEADPFYAAATDLALPGPSPTLEAAAAANRIAVPPNAALPDARVCA